MPQFGRVYNRKKERFLSRGRKSIFVICTSSIKIIAVIAHHYDEIQYSTEEFRLIPLQAMNVNAPPRSTCPS
eukprot:scaffold3400_cov169-Amphora_coffeaeformis.AAC.14